MTLDKFADVLLNLQNEGYDFSIFIKKKDETRRNTLKFTQAFVTPAAERLLPLNIWDLVEDESIFKYDKQSIGPKCNYKTINLPLDSWRFLERYLYSAFRNLRQVPCKSIVKVWIKAIEPRKKTKYPYIKGELTKPDWWPANVQHKEPDHLQKDDRMRLMIAIILAVLPEKQDCMVLDDLRQSTLALSLFKREPHKHQILLSVFDICEALCDGDLDRSISVIDLSQFTARQGESLGCVRQVKVGTFQQNPHLCSEVPWKVTDEDHTIGSSSISAPMLVDLLVASDQDLLDIFNHSPNDELIKM